jgi:uncharacterized protein (TIGR00369 family)
VADAHEEILETLRRILPDDPPLAVPPAIFVEFGARMLEYAPGRALVCAFPSQAKFANPAGFVQGGILMAAFDIAFGTLAFLEARRACSTITMEASFLRPVAADGRDYQVRVRLKAKTRTVLFLDGRVRGPDGKTIATAGTTMAPMKARD